MTSFKIDNFNGNENVKITLTSNKKILNLGESITFTASIKNSAPAILEDLFIKYNLQNGLKVNEETLTINNQKTFSNIAEGVSVPRLAYGEEAVIVFDAIVSNIPTINPIKNILTLEYKLLGEKKSIRSNILEIQIGEVVGNVLLTKTVDKNVAVVSDVLTYTAKIKNIGNVSLENGIFVDTLLDGLTFISDTVIVDGTNTVGGNPFVGISLKPLAINEETVLIYKVLVNKIPIKNVKDNLARVDFNYMMESAIVSNFGISNDVYTKIVPLQVGAANLILEKLVNTDGASVSEDLTYTINISNVSTILAENILLKDIVPDGTSFVDGSVVVNNNPVPNGSPIVGINVPNIEGGKSAVVSFKVKIDNMPNINPIRNKATADYTYVNNPLEPPISTSSESNVVLTNITPKDIITLLNKGVNKNFANLNDKITYIISTTNSSTIIVENLVFIDTIPDKMTFVIGSVKVNGLSMPNENPENGVQIKTLMPGDSITVSFDVIIDNTASIGDSFINTSELKYSFKPSSTGEYRYRTITSNSVKTVINKALIEGNGFIKSADKNGAEVGDTITYRIELLNSGNISAENTILRDDLQAGTSFVQGSVTVDGEIRANSTPLGGINVGTVSPGQKSIVLFKVRVDAIPEINPLINKATLNYEYKENPNSASRVLENSTSNEIFINIVDIPIKPGVNGFYKRVDLDDATVDDILIFTVTSKNNSSVLAKNVMVTDSLDSNLDFIENSVTIDGVLVPGGNIQSGISLGNIKPLEAKIVEFKAQIKTQPSANTIKNISNLKYSYSSDTGIDKEISILSNETLTRINYANISTIDEGFIKSTNKNYISKNEELTYNIFLKNTGNVSANNIIFFDTVPENTEFIHGSVFVGGINFPLEDPESSFNVGNLRPNESKTISFKVMVTSIPDNALILNNARVRYNFTVNPNEPNGRTKESISNNVSSKVNVAIIDQTIENSLEKFTDLEFGIRGDIITYSIFMKNVGNVDAINTIFRDTIPNGTSFINNSVSIDSVDILGVNPSSGVLVGTVAPYESKLLKFKVKVIDFPNKNPIENLGTVAYEYVVNEETGAKVLSGSDTNIVTTQINEARISLLNGDILKSVDKSFAKLNDTLTYRISLKNSGTVESINTKFYDNIPLGTEFIPDSVTIDGKVIKGASPDSGVNIGVIRIGQIIFIEFKVKITSLPNNNKISNKGNITYDYIIDPIKGKRGTGADDTNTVDTFVNEAILNFSKSSSKEFVKINDIITYKINIQNNGNTTANTVTVKDTLPDGVTFIDGSLKINGIITSGDIENGINVGSISPKLSTVVEYSVKVDKIPKINPMPNKAKISYYFTINPETGETSFNEGFTNEVLTTVNTAIIKNEDGGFIKRADKGFVEIGEILTYFINIVNTGNVNAENVNLIDPIPDGLEFILGSLYVNGELSNESIQAGIKLKNIMPNEKVSIEFKVKAINLPPVNPALNKGIITFDYLLNPNTLERVSELSNTNIVETKINDALLRIEKIQSKDYATVDENFKYTILIKVNGNIDANNVVVYDTLPDGLKFVEGSISVNGDSKPLENIEKGILIGRIKKGDAINVTYDVKVVKVSEKNPIINIAEVIYTCTKNPDNPNGEEKRNISNEAKVYINNADISVETSGLLKTRDMSFVDLNDTITYTVSLTNKGNTAANSVVLLDTLSKAVKFIEGTVFVNSKNEFNYNPNIGIPVGTIKPLENVLVSFKALVISLPNPNIIENDGTVMYNYTIDPSIPNSGYKENKSNKVLTVVNRAIISNEDGGFIKKASLGAADVNEMIDYTILLKNTGNVQAENVVLLDTLVAGISYVPNTLYVDGKMLPMDDIEKGIILNDIPSGYTRTVTFKVKINKIPENNEIINFGNVSYRYLINPNEERYNSANNKTNLVKTIVNTADISYETGGFIKNVNKEFIDLGEILVYTIKVKNNGNVDALDVIFTDTVPKDTVFIQDSLSLNGVVKQGQTPENGVLLGTIAPLDTVLVSFKVLSVSLPKDLIIENNSKVTYSYIVNKEAPIRRDKENYSNTIKTKLRHGEIDITKKTDKAFATIGETITYTLNLKNTGNVDVNDVYVIDTVPEGTIFIDNTLKIEDVFIPGENLQTGVYLGTIKANEKRTLVFSVLIVSIPKENPIQNTGMTKYTYIIDEVNNIKNNGASISNKVETKVNYVIINKETGSLKKIVNKEYSDLNEKITYTIEMTNLGNVSASNIIFTDTIPVESKFIVGSLKLNGEYIKNGTPDGGIDVGILNPSQKATISFDVLIITLPKNNPLINSGAINYRYTKNPSEPLSETGYKRTNEVTTYINHGEVTDGFKETSGSEPKGGFTKVANKEYAKLNEEITYSFNVTNTGNVTINSVILTDLLNSELKFVKGSVQIDGILMKDEDPEKGINIGSIGSLKSKNVILKAVVTSLPNDNIVTNKATLEYRYKVDPSKPEVIKTAVSNEESVTINAAIISNLDNGLVKQVDKAYAKLNDILNYRVVLKNTGNVPAIDVIFKDITPMGTIFIKDSVKINNETKTSVYPQTGIKIGVIKPNEKVIVEFAVKIVAVIQNGLIENKAEAIYSYTVNPNQSPVEESNYSNIVTTKLNTVNFEGDNFTKAVTPTEATLNDIVTYSFLLRNGGNVNATKVMFTDTLPSEMIFIEDSVSINGENIKNADPRIGIGIATIKPNEIISISFNAKVLTLPNKSGETRNIGKITYENIVDPQGEINKGYDYSNVGILKIKKAIILASKIALDKTSAVGDTIRYKVILKNTGNAPADEIEIYDELPECLEFVEDSVSVGCINTKENIVSGITVSDLEPDEEIEVFFTTRVICRPEDGVINNEVKGNYSFYVSKDRPEIIDHFLSNIASVIVENPEITIVKCANKEIAKYGDEVDYFITLENTGTLELFNVKFIDLLPEELRLIGQTIFVNGKRVNGIDLSKGISLGDMPLKAKVEICYKVLVVKGCCRKLIENKAYTKFIYKIGENQTPKKTTSRVCIHALKGVSTSFQQLTIDGVCRLPCNMPRIEDVTNVTGQIEITKQYVIDTVRGYSAENRRITGHKLVVNGRIFENIEFIAQEPTQKTHYQGNIEKFSTFIILSEDYNPGSNIEVQYEIEDIHFEQIGEKEIFISVTMILDAIVTC